MQGLTTRNLLAYLRSLHRCRSGDDGRVDLQITKSTKEWQETYLAAKEVLATREHVQRNK